MTNDILPSPSLDEKEARLVGALELAYLGDTIYDLFVRTRLIYAGSVKEIHRAAVQEVNATAQAAFARAILPLLTEAESDVFRRGRNAHAHHQAPKAASVSDYAAATGLESLLGYLYLTGNFTRINELFGASARPAESCPPKEDP